MTMLSKEDNDAIMEVFEVFHQAGEEWVRKQKEKETINKKEEEQMTQKVQEWEIERYQKDQLIEDTTNTILKLLTEKHITVRIALWILAQAENEIKRSTDSTKLGSPIICQPVSVSASYDKEAVIKEINRRKKKNKS